ncbi:MAG: 6-phosphogluconate dehydrogenase [Colwelliaceae bacterium]|nr:6-phosphogluconate dehydrogenase [Colwelliaceae bacterium]
MKEVGIYGLGRMGSGMSERLLKTGFKVIVHNRSHAPIKKLKKKGAVAAYELEEFVGKLSKGKRVIWLMLPAGKVTDKAIRDLLPLLTKGDIIVDGANDFYGNAEKHATMCKKKGVKFFDSGVSGGVWGLKNGYTLMVGGPKKDFKRIEPICKALAPKDGYGYFGPAGSGHFVKSVHNIIEYTYLQGIAEGVELLDKFKHPVDLKKATKVWGPASVIKSWLIDLTNTALERPDFKHVGTEIGSVTIGELRKTKRAVRGYAPAFDVAVKIRQSKRKRFSLGKRVIAAVRKEFGGHAVKKKGGKK